MRSLLTQLPVLARLVAMTTVLMRPATFPQAGAVEIWEVQAGAAVTINGTFLNNSAVDPQGPCGDRGGAIAIRWVRSPVRINGTFIANHVCGRCLRRKEWPASCTPAGDLVLTGNAYCKRH
jgi:hypothetical protein